MISIKLKENERIATRVSYVWPPAAAFGIREEWPNDAKWWQLWKPSRVYVYQIVEEVIQP